MLKPYNATQSMSVTLREERKLRVLRELGSEKYIGALERGAASNRNEYREYILGVKAAGT